MNLLYCGEQSISYSDKGELVDKKIWISKNNHSIELSENVIKLFTKNNLNINELDKQSKK